MTTTYDRFTDIEMVSQESSMDPNSSGVHQLIMSNSITNPDAFDGHEYPSFGSNGRNRNLIPQPSGVLPSIQSLGKRFSQSVELFQDPSLSKDSQTCNRRHLMNLLEAANDKDYQGRRLSLTLGSQFPSHMLVSSHHVNQLEHIRDDDTFTNASSSTSQNQSHSTLYETKSFAIAVGNSRYLKSAQSLLEEVVSVGGNAIDLTSGESIKRLTSKGFGVSPELPAELYSSGFSSTEDPDIQTRITELITLLDELDSRYEKYYHHMEDMVSSYEMIAGIGAAKTYTAQALQAMSRHFCNLRDAIITQIRKSKRQLSHSFLKAHSGVSQHSLLDQVTRNDGLSLQHLGFIQNRQTWRPTRGLPQNSVGVLRSWLFEHFLHPYPNDSEKLMLASQTGLTKNQVSYWFINARVRLWKPMIEEMYKEEFAESSKDLNELENRLSDHARK